MRQCTLLARQWEVPPFPFLSPHPMPQIYQRLIETLKTFLRLFLSLEKAEVKDFLSLSDLWVIYQPFKSISNQHKLSYLQPAINYTMRSTAG